MAPGSRIPGPVPKEALGFFAAKGIKPGFSYQDVWAEEHKAAFTVAKIMEQDILITVHDSLIKAIQDGTTFEKWVKDMKPMFDKSGWSAYNRTKRQRKHRLKTIYQTNMRTSRARGQWERIERTKKSAPNLLYGLGPSQRHRPVHLGWEGLILPADHPFWDEAMPPNGYGCFVPGTMIDNSEDVIGASKAWYTGDVVELQFKSGARLTVTPNHPVATTGGLLAAGLLKVGAQCFHHRGSSTLPPSGIAGAKHHVPTPVEDIFDSLGSHGCRSVKVSDLDFHGEAVRFIGKVDVVGSYVQLGRRTDAETIGQFLRRHSGSVEIDDLAVVRRRPFSGHVHDLQSVNGYVWSGGILAGNCKCYVTQLTSYKTEKLGGIKRAPPRVTRPWKDPKTGRVKMIRKGIQPGFDHNPGKKSSREKTLEEQKRDTRTDLRDAQVRAAEAVKKVK